jgi:hypothetical protein
VLSAPEVETSGGGLPLKAHATGCKRWQKNTLARLYPARALETG